MVMMIYHVCMNCVYYTHEWAWSSSSIVSKCCQRLCVCMCVCLSLAHSHRSFSVVSTHVIHKRSTPPPTPTPTPPLPSSGGLSESAKARRYVHMWGYGCYISMCLTFYRIGYVHCTYFYYSSAFETLNKCKLLGMYLCINHSIQPICVFLLQTLSVYIDVLVQWWLWASHWTGLYRQKRF